MINQYLLTKKLKCRQRVREVLIIKIQFNKYHANAVRKKLLLAYKICVRIQPFFVKIKVSVCIGENIKAARKFYNYQRFGTK